MLHSTQADHDHVGGSLCVTSHQVYFFAMELGVSSRMAIPFPTISAVKTPSGLFGRSKLVLDIILPLRLQQRSKSQTKASSSQIKFSNILKRKHVLSALERGQRACAAAEIVQQRVGSRIRLSSPYR